MTGVCLAAACCGSDEEGAPIPAEQAQALENRLDEVQRRFDFGGGACADIENDSRQGIQEILATIPGDVSADVRDALQEGFDRLFTLSSDECQAEEEEAPEEPLVPEPEVDPEAEPEPTTPETTPTDTGEETVPEEPVDPPAEEPPADEGDDGGGTIAPGDG